ncbi:hypothetical protein KI387_023563, partial [Taxus chinensis]
YIYTASQYKTEAVMAYDRVRWGELKEEDNEDLDFLLPPTNIIGLDENGVKKIVEYKFNEQGQKVVHTTTTHIHKVAEARLNKRALERREWRKFDAAANQEPSVNFTGISLKEIPLECPHPLGSKADDSKSGGDALSALAGSKGGAVLMVFRICGKKGNHWTLKWTYKDLAPAGATDTLTMDKAAEGLTAGGSSAGGTATSSAVG